MNAGRFRKAHKQIHALAMFSESIDSVEREREREREFLLIPHKNPKYHLGCSDCFISQSCRPEMSPRK